MVYNAYAYSPLGQTAGAPGYHLGTKMALSTSTVAVGMAGYGLVSEAAAGLGMFSVSSNIATRAMFLGTRGSRWFSTMQARHLISTVPRAGNFAGRTPFINWLTTAKYSQPGGGEVVLNWWTRKIIHAIPR